MNNKLEYLAKLFQKTGKKKIEHYVLTRLWHQLDNDEVKMVPQQYVARHTEKYALTDVYFPQVGIHIEVNEPPHYDNERRIQADEIRKLEIEKNTGHKVYVIDCRSDLREIHHQINVVIDVIKNRIEEQKKVGNFKPWNPDSEFDPSYWKSKKEIKVSDEISLRTIEDICLLFDADVNKTKRGYQRRGSIEHPRDKEVRIWWPSEKSRSGWINKYDAENGIITETHADSQKKVDHYKHHASRTQIRYVFLKHVDFLGFKNYKFLGIFQNDLDKSGKDIGTIWVKVGDVLNLETLTYHEV